MIVVELVVEVSEPVSEVAAAGQPLVQPPGLSCDMARRGDGHQSSHQGDNDIKKYWSQRERDTEGGEKPVRKRRYFHSDRLPGSNGGGGGSAEL